MTIVTPPRAPAEATDGPELLISEARRRRRRRWMIGLAVPALCASGAGIGFMLSGSGSGDGGAHAGPPSHTDPPSAATTALVHGQWAALASSPLMETALGPTVAAHGNELFVWGRTSDGTGAIFDARTNRWTTVPPAPISGRTGVAATWAGQAVFVWGGFTSRSPTDPTGFAATGALYDPTTHRWSTLPPAPLAARARASAVWTGNEVIVFGGVTAQGPAPAFQDRPIDGAVYSPATGQWQGLPAFPAPSVPGAQATSLALWTRTSLLVMAQYGGRLHDGRRETWSGPLIIASWTPGASAWHLLERRRPPSLDPQRWGPSTVSPTLLRGAGHVWTGSRLVFVHGNEGCRGMTSCGGGPPDLAGPNTFTVATATWSKTPESTIHSIGSAATWTGRSIVTLGATGAGRAYDPAAGRWEPIPAAPLDQPGGAAWTGRSVIAWASTRHHVEVEELVPASSKGS